MTIPEISVQELAALGTAVRVVDVREPDEWESGHIGHAVHVPLGTVPDNLDAFDGTPAYVVCLGGVRSLKACEVAAAHGDSVVNVTGGMRAWLEAGFDVVTSGPDGD